MRSVDMKRRVNRRSAAVIVLSALVGLLVVNVADRNWIAAAVLGSVILVGGIAVRTTRHPR